MKKIIKILDTFFNNKTIKNLVIYGITLLIFHITSEGINSLVVKYLTMNQNSLIKTPEILVFSVFGITFIYIIYKLVLKKYQLSSVVSHSIFSVSILYLIARFTNYSNGWLFISFNDKGIKYIDFIGLIFLVSTLIIVILFIIKSLSKEKLLDVKNPFVSDDPILSKSEDKLNYQKRASDIISYLERSSFNNSFTIGIVGPWGNGKSSLIGLIE